MRRKELLNSFVKTIQKGCKQYKYLYRQMLQKSVIRKAYKKLRKGKTRRKEIRYIDANLDDEVDKMQLMILNTKPEGEKVDHPELAYRPKKRTPKYIKEHGKIRKIYMPEIHEQWLHHIIMVVLEPIIMATAYKYSCGSFPKRGAHYGKKIITKWIRAGKDIRNFAKADIRHFYDNIRHDILMKELSIRIKDEWFLYIIALCFDGFVKGIALGFYISQWLANYLLEPLDKFVTETLGIKKYVRYVDDIILYDDNKKKLHNAIVEIKKMLGRRFRLKLKSNYQICKFIFKKKNGKLIGRPLNFMGFIFYRERVTIRKHIMLSATRTAQKLKAAKDKGHGYYEGHIRRMISYIGWFSHSNTYGCYEDKIKPCVDIGKLKKIIGKIDRRRYKNETMERRTVGITSGGAAAYSAA